MITWIYSAADSDRDRLGATDPARSYRVVYLVEDFAAGGAAASTEILTVRRPFESRVEVRSGRPPGTERLSLTIGGFAQQQRTSGAEASVLTVEPSPPPGDVRVDGLLDDAVARGLLVATDERRELEGRPCDVYRTAGRELCIDEGGIVLGDELVVDGEVRRRRTAISVAVNPARLADEDFAITGTPVPPADGGGAIREVTADSRTDEATVYEMEAGAEGFRHRGRYAITPAGSVGETGIVPTGVRAVGVIDVWTRGPDFVAVFNGGTDDQADPFADDPRARPVEFASRLGESVVSLAGAEVRADLGEGRFVRVYGTVAVDELVALARRLEPKTGGTITPVDA